MTVMIVRITTIIGMVTMIISKELDVLGAGVSTVLIVEDVRGRVGTCIVALVEMVVRSAGKHTYILNFLIY